MIVSIEQRTNVHEWLAAGGNAPTADEISQMVNDDKLRQRLAKEFFSYWCVENPSGEEGAPDWRCFSDDEEGQAEFFEALDQALVLLRDKLDTDNNAENT